MEDIEILIPEDKIRKRIREMAMELSVKYRGKDVCVLGVLNGAAYFLTALTQAMSIPVEVDFIAASSYGSGTVSSGHVEITRDTRTPIEGKHVIVVEDIADTGHTLHQLVQMLWTKKPAGVELCVLLDKPDRRVAPLYVDYTGFTIPDKFVVGWGMDYNYKYRNLPYIGVINNC